MTGTKVPTNQSQPTAGVRWQVTRGKGHVAGGGGRGRGSPKSRVQSPESGQGGGPSVGERGTDQERSEGEGGNSYYQEAGAGYRPQRPKFGIGIKDSQIQRPERFAEVPDVGNGRVGEAVCQGEARQRADGAGGALDGERHGTGKG